MKSLLGHFSVSTWNLFEKLLIGYTYIRICHTVNYVVGFAEKRPSISKSQWNKKKINIFKIRKKNDFLFKSSERLVLVLKMLFVVVCRLLFFFSMLSSYDFRKVINKNSGNSHTKIVYTQPKPLKMWIKIAAIKVKKTK